MLFYILKQAVEANTTEWILQRYRQTLNTRDLEQPLEKKQAMELQENKDYSGMCASRRRRMRQNDRTLTSMTYTSELHSWKEIQQSEDDAGRKTHRTSFKNSLHNKKPHLKNLLPMLPFVHVSHANRTATRLESHPGATAHQEKGSWECLAAD